MIPKDDKGFEYWTRMMINGGVKDCTVLYYKGECLAKRNRVPNPVDLQVIVESIADSSNFGLWDWKNWNDLVVMRCDKYNESIIIYPNAA